ncbi:MULTISPECIES: GntR family transcriptional regulator [Vagococcus]|uniref:Transcriptional regulator, GntR family n=1 Tax=Vagococcus fluvialis bH819 TaxID=1255619 RepID=A0A1X8XKW5_9ENTE|nr:MULTISPECIES: GntR family transcriptional regulator [Vagococcus]SLM84469.1 Transcriptional regulator, GntR family [Vagococcus fluvialis bH819]HCM90509.1 GntR family transcriptional regulator [Vagococcus sp.]
MTKQKETRSPRYQQVAIEIAERIVDNRYVVGDKLYARSTLASTFSVSPETARKAVNILVDLKILEVKHGSGVIVASKQRAISFLEQFRDVQSIEEIKNNLMNSLKQQKEELNNVTILVNQLVSQTVKINQVNPLLPSELVLNKEASHLEISISELNLWQETGATVIAILHKEELILSPGPYAVLNPNDTLYFVGDEFATQRMINFFYPN